MKNSLYLSLLSRLKNKHDKLANRFYKNVRDGEFQKQRYRKRKKDVNRLKGIERQIAQLSEQIGTKPHLNYKHWAVAIAMGVVVSANAQQNRKKDFEERLKQHANQVINNVQPLAQTVFYEPKVGIGVPLFNQFHTGDLDGDGDIDAIYVPYLDSPIILTNEGAFNFSVSALTTTPLEIVEQTILGDFDGDSDLDLFMRNGTYGAIGAQMWLNDGSGNFTSQAVTFPAVDFDDDRLTAVDIDGDGDLDFVGETRQDSPAHDFVTVFNNVGFDFSDTTAYKSSNMSQSSRLVAPMDVDGDMDIDIVYTSVVPSFSNYGVQILENNGSGVFSRANSYLAPTNNFEDGTVTIDFDNDGDLDFLSFPSGVSGVSVRPFTSTGTIPTDGTSPFTEGTDVMLSSSVNDDGEDIFSMRIDTDAFEDFVANTEDSTFVLISNGAGLFTEQIKLAGQSKPGDLDGDGDADLFYFDGNVSIRDNQGGGTFLQGSDILTISATYDTQLVDLDGDGDLDLAQGGAVVSRSLFNDGSGNFTVNQEFPGDAYKLAFGDLDGDSDLDMVVALEGDGTYPGFIIYSNNGSGNLTYSDNLGTGYETDQVVLADMDEDGDLDIVAIQDGASNDYIRIYDNQGGLTFSMTTSYLISPDANKMDIENIDGDTDKDIVLSLGTSGFLAIINNTGTLAAGEAVVPLGSNFEIEDVDLADLDGDGDMDVFASNAYESPTANSYVFLNNGSGIFTDSGLNVVTGNTYSSFLGDVDGDGDVDIISGGYISYPKLWINDGSANFAFDHDIPTITTEYSSINMGDLDGDGDQDIVIGDYYGGTNIFFNSAMAPNQLEADSLALNAIFDTMGGANWTDATNWQSGDVSTWFGVTLNATQDRVIRLELPNNELTGTLPASIDQLDALEFLDLSSNRIDALATQFSGLVNAIDINLNGNRLDFGDLEEVAGVSVLSYTNQQQLSEGISENGPIEIPVGSTQMLTVNANGTSNTYQWQYEGQDIMGATGPTYTITDIDRSNMGEYGLEISNSVATGVTLTAAPIEVLATAVISVNVVDDTETLITENVNGYILEIEAGQVGFDTVQVATQENVPSNFVFPAIVLGDFLVNVSSDDALYVPTYYSDAFLWDEADTLRLNSDSTIQVTITDVPPERTSADGDGIVSGSIEEDFGDDASRIDARRRAARRKCGLRRKRSGGRIGQDDEFVLIAYGETNDNGEFEYGFLAQGTYRFFVEYPGVPLDESAFVQFDVGEAGVGDNSFRLAVFASEDGIFIELILGLTSPSFTDFSIYPNPTADIINIDYKQTKPEALSLEIFDMQGKAVLTKKLNGQGENISIDISDFEKGQYIFRLIDEDRKDLVVYKIIKN